LPTASEKTIGAGNHHHQVLKDKRIKPRNMTMPIEEEKPASGETPQVTDDTTNGTPLEGEQVGVVTFAEQPFVDLLPSNNELRQRRPSNIKKDEDDENAERIRRRRRSTILYQNPEDIDDPQHPRPSKLNRQSMATMPDSIRLATSQKHVMRAILAVLVCVFVDAINLQCAAPNYPLMVTIGGHPDSFPNTDPFDFAAAQYMLYTAAKFGAFISNLTAGTMSDRYGRRRMLMIDLAGSVIFTLAKYFARNSYWMFVAMTFVNGLFASSASVALGYMADIFVNDRAKADMYMNNVVAIALVGRSLGGLFTVMFPDDLFLPLIPATALTFLGLLVAFKFVLEPRGVRDDEAKEKKGTSHGDEKAEQDPPETMDNKTLFNIIFGALMDNAGSAGIIRKCYFCALR
jgi:hypothetical protein